MADVPVLIKWVPVPISGELLFFVDDHSGILSGDSQGLLVKNRYYAHDRIVSEIACFRVLS